MGVAATAGIEVLLKTPGSVMRDVSCVSSKEKIRF